jgi:O-antigen/teichoic acid export membrane protein
MIKLFSRGNKIADINTIISRNIAWSLIFKGCNMILGILLISYSIKVLTPEKYGIWITIYSVINWFIFLDLGIGNGFRNYFIQALSFDKLALARKYLQTLFSGSLIISIIGLFVFLVVNVFVNWYKFLNLPDQNSIDLPQLIVIAFILFFIQFNTKNISVILLSMQKTALNEAINLVTTILTICIVVLYNNFYLIDLMTFSFVFLISPILIQTLAFIFFFRGENRFLQFRVRLFPEVKLMRKLFRLGFKFFVIQVLALILFSSLNFLILRIHGPKAVSQYSVAYQLFSSFLIIFSVVLSPFWSAFALAFSKKDLVWIKNVLLKLILAWICYFMVLTVVFYNSSKIFSLWLGTDFFVDPDMVLQVYIFISFLGWTSIFSTFLAGTGELNISILVAVIQVSVFIMLISTINIISVCGAEGIIIALNCSMLIPSIILPIQTCSIIYRKAL